MHNPKMPNLSKFDNRDEYHEALDQYDAEKEAYDEWVEIEIDRRREEETKDARIISINR